MVQLHLLLQLLESTLTRVLERHGVPADDRNFKACFQKLYTITKCFLKVCKIEIVDFGVLTFSVQPYFDAC